MFNCNPSKQKKYRIINSLTTSEKKKKMFMVFEIALFMTFTTYAAHILQKREQMLYSELIRDFENNNIQLIKN